MTTVRRKNLVILRAGDGSLHRNWIVDAERDFDLFISYYGKTEGRHREDAELWEHRPGPKWSCIADLLAERPELLDQYQGFWFPDDDLDADTATINRLFALFHGLQLKLAQPALTRDSYYSWAQLLQRPGSVMRRVAFVEVMAPLFDRQALRRCVPSFAESRSGWGLDFVWPHLLGADGRQHIGILDATPVKHTRPIGGELYKNNPELDPRRDDERLVKQYGLRANRYEGKFICNSVLSERQLPLWERLVLGLKRLNAKRLSSRRARQGR